LRLGKSSPIGWRSAATSRRNSTKAFQEKQAAAMAANPSQYTIGGVANATLIPLLNDGLVRPLNTLVEEYGQDLAQTQLIDINGDIMAIAMMV
jgi:cell pole-organizing protein PopZ